VARTRVVTAEALTTASPAAVYALLADAPSWRRWAGPLVTYAAWETPPGPGGGPPVRRLGRRPFLVREEVVVAEPPSRHAYRLLSGQPVRSYEAEVRIGVEGAGGRTRVEWTGRVVPLPWTGWLVERAFARMLRGFARRLAEEAATPADEPAGPEGPS
jgi:hypothetical protein